jgi:DNA-binding transcriptional ArsR family regulator
MGRNLTERNSGVGRKITAPPAVEVETVVGFHPEAQEGSPMASPSELAPALARAVGNPMRVRILAALGDGPRTLERLVAEVDADRRSVTRHAGVLEQAGLVQRTGPRGRATYSLSRTLMFSDDEYGAIPSTAREAAVAAALAHCHTAAVSALEQGGFDREDIHLSRTTLELTEPQWRELATGFADLLDRVEAMADSSPAPADERCRASAVMMLFERPALRHARSEIHEEPEPFSVEEGLDRAWGLSEEIDDALTGAGADWATVVALADRLRVVARAALAAELRQREGRDAGHRAGAAR